MRVKYKEYVAVIDSESPEDVIIYRDNKRTGFAYVDAGISEEDLLDGLKCVTEYIEHPERFPVEKLE